MAKFRFRLQRVLDYRSSLVEAQEAQVARQVVALRRAEAELESVRALQRNTVGSLEIAPGVSIEPRRANLAWDYLESLRRREASGSENVSRETQALIEERERLADLKRQEQTMAKLKERQLRAAMVAARLAEAKVLDDLVSARHGRNEHQ